MEKADFGRLALKTAVFAVMLCTLAAAACAEEVSPFGGGGLAFRDLDVSFAPRIVYLGWKGKARLAAGKDAGSFALDLSDGPGGSVDGRLETRLVGDGAVAAHWSFTPSTNVWVESCGLQALLPVYRYADGALEADGKAVHLAKDYGKSLQFRGRVSKLAFRDAHGRETFALAFPKPADVLVQDSRGWKCPWFELRIFLGKRLAAGKTVKAGFRLTVPKGVHVKLNQPGKYLPAASDEWRPIAFPSKVEPGSAVDFTSFAVSHAPAGKYGYAVVRDGHFEFENLPGVTQRFYGINVCYGSCYPDTPEMAEGMASYFAACGYNAIRIHHHDFKVTVGKGGVVMDESLLRRMDSLVDACVRHGLYITTDLFCSRGRSVAWRDVGIDADGTVGSYKAMAILHAGTTENLKQFTRNFLCHRNVYTGRRLADEPALSWISLINEGMLAQNPTPKAGTTAYAVMSGIWKGWLEKKHAEGAFADVSCDLPAGARVKQDDAPDSRALRTFYAEKEAAFAAEMRRFLREEIGCRALLTSLNSGFPPAEYAAFRQANFDYTDTHYYWDHPKSPLPGGATFGLPSVCQHDGKNPLCTPNRAHRSGPRLPGQPLTVTEFHYCPPGRFRGFSGLLTGANAAHDAWSGAWRFCWGGRPGVCAPLEDRPLRSWFELGADPVALAGERVAAMLFLRGDLQAGAAPFGEGDGIAIDPVDGSLSVTTARTCGGYRPFGVIDAGALRADVGTEGACVWVTSLADAPVSDSSRLLLAHLTDGTDSGTVFRDGRRILVERWGNLPHLLRAGRADVSVAVRAGAWRVYALDASGRRRKEIPATRRHGRLSFRADVSIRPDDATIFYELTCD